MNALLSGVNAIIVSTTAAWLYGSNKTTGVLFAKSIGLFNVLESKNISLVLNYITRLRVLQIFHVFILIFFI